MPQQNYSNHFRLVKGYHLFLWPLLISGLIGSIVNFILSFHVYPANHYNAALILLLFICSLLISYYVRSFALRAQDRAIRAEENLRYYILTGKFPDPQLRLGQLIALRFASDEELSELAKKAIDERLSNKQIKQLIKNWKADYHRV